MKIYLLTPTKKGHASHIWGYDCYDGFVIIAENKTGARKLANENGGSENGFNNENDVWLNPELTEIEEMGLLGHSFTKTGIILSDFAAG